jgi:hypothetical protein
MALQGGEDGEGGGSDIGALLGNLGPLLGGLSGVSVFTQILPSRQIELTNNTIDINVVRCLNCE